jgi:hypothetical protein
MIDGAVARRTGTVSKFGTKLDAVADIVFISVCLIKIFACNAYSGMALHMDSRHSGDKTVQYRYRIHQTETIHSSAFCDQQSDRRNAVHFSIDADIYRFEIQCGSRLCNRNNSGIL